MPPTELQSQKTMPATMEVTGTQPMSTMKIPGGPLSDMPDRLRVVKELSDPFRNIGPTVGSSTGVSERNFAPFPDDFPMNRQKPPMTEQKAINDNELRKSFLRQSMNPDDLLTTPEEWKVAEADVLNTPAGNMRRFNTDQIRADNALMQMHRLDQEARSQGQPSPTAIAAADQYYGADPNMAARHAANGDKLAKDWLARRMSLERPSEVAAMQQYERFRTGDESDPAVARAMQLQKKYQAPLGSVAERPLSDKAEARRMLLRNARGGDVGLTGDAEAELAGVSRNTRNYAQDLAERKARAAMRGLERGAVREARRGNLGPMQDLAVKRAGGEDGEGPQLLPVGLARSPQEAALVNQHNSGVLEYRAQMARNKSEGDRWQADQLRQAGLDWDNVYATNSQLLGDPEAAYELTVQQRGGRPSGAMIGPPVPGSPTAASGDVTLYQAGRVRQRALENPGVVAIGITPTSGPSDVSAAIRNRIESGGAVDPATLGGLRYLVASIATDPEAMSSLPPNERAAIDAILRGQSWNEVVAAYNAAIPKPNPPVSNNPMSVPGVPNATAGGFLPGM